ncbi:hypothetical protein [Streptomyces sp. NPDC055400]
MRHRTRPLFVTTLAALASLLLFLSLVLCNEHRQEANILASTFDGEQNWLVVPTGKGRACSQPQAVDQ